MIPASVPVSPNQTGPEYLTVAEAAKRLRLNRKTIYMMVDKKQLPGARRFRGVIRVHWPTVVKWMEMGGPQP
jgi:excisionase family DNA binding protein